MNRTKTIQQIHDRLGRLEDQREEARIKDEPVNHIDDEMIALRQKLQLVMNSSCPILQELSCSEE